MSKQQLVVEALVVGAAMLPVWWVTTRFTSSMNFGAEKAAVDVFVSAAAFHLLAEQSGVNEWFLSNSHAAQKTFHRDFRYGRVLSNDLGRIWSPIFMGRFQRSSSQ